MSYDVWNAFHGERFFVSWRPILLYSFPFSQRKKGINLSLDEGIFTFAFLNFDDERLLMTAAYVFYFVYDGGVYYFIDLAVLALSNEASNAVLAAAKSLTLDGVIHGICYLKFSVIFKNQCSLIT